MFNNSMKHSKEVTQIWREYNKEISGSDFIGANIYENILRHKPCFQSEILQIMFNEGYEKAINDINSSVERWNKVLLSNKEWINITDNFISIFNDLMEYLPENKQSILMELEDLGIQQSEKELEIITNYLKINNSIK